MAQTIFLNMPVSDVERSARFYEAFGCTRDPRFSRPDTAAAMRLSDAIVFMLSSHAHFAIFSPHPAADARKTAQVLFCISRESRADVDATLERVAAAGGRTDVPNGEDGEPVDFMYGRNFEDPDGHLFEVMWMDPDAAARAAAG